MFQVTSIEPGQATENGMDKISTLQNISRPENLEKEGIGILVAGPEMFDWLSNVFKLPRRVTSIDVRLRMDEPAQITATFLAEWKK